MNIHTVLYLLLVQIVSQLKILFDSACENKSP